MTGKAIRDGFLRMINIETIKGTTHAHPDILRPNIGKLIATAMKVDPMIIHIMKGISNFLILITVKLLSFIPTLHYNLQKAHHIETFS
jgi:hypothetical protein